MHHTSRCGTRPSSGQGTVDGVLEQDGRCGLGLRFQLRGLADLDRVDAFANDPAKHFGFFARFLERYDVVLAQPHVAGSAVQGEAELPGLSAPLADLQIHSTVVG